jgi:hypothetical protein
MRPVERGSWPLSAKRNKQKNFGQYRFAKDYLTERTGWYCHFCERRAEADLGVEHIKPKAYFPNLASSWHNFLLACTYCNSSKNDQIPRDYRKNYVWPHLDDTHLLIEFELVFPFVPKAVEGSNEAANVIELYGLQKIETHFGGKYRPFILRLEALKKAIDLRQAYENGVATTRSIADHASSIGFFSVWMKVFEDMEEVRSAILSHPDFRMEGKNFFDAKASPLPRQ